MPELNPEDNNEDSNINIRNFFEIPAGFIGDIIDFEQTISEAIPKKPPYMPKKGDRVIYTGGKYGDNPENPLWGGRYGGVIGTVIKIQKLKTYSLMGDSKEVIFAFVKWDNGKTNDYNITLDPLEPYTNQKQPKPLPKNTVFL